MIVAAASRREVADPSLVIEEPFLLIPREGVAEDEEAELHVAFLQELACGHVAKWLSCPRRTSSSFPRQGPTGPFRITRTSTSSGTGLSVAVRPHRTFAPHDLQASIES